MGAARVEAAGPWQLTFTAAEGVEAARAFQHAAIMPLHYEGWADFTEHRAEIQRAFDEAGMGDRLCRLSPGTPETLSWSMARDAGPKRKIRAVNR